MKTKNNIYYLVIFIVAILAKMVYRTSSNDDLVFMLKPLCKIVSLVMDTNYSYATDIGFYFENLNITIDKSCSGINFWIISFVIFSILFLKTLTYRFQKITAISIILLATYLFTLFANTSRILSAIIVAKQIHLDYPWLHNAEGVFIYLSILILTYIAINHLLLKFNNHNEKLT